MLDKKFFEFKEQPVVKQADLTAEYQLTKIAEDKYQWYNFSVNEAQLLNTKGALKAIASIRGGKCLTKELTDKVIAMPTMTSLTVSASALKLAKQASTEEFEPWKVVAVNGVEYFVNAGEIEEECVKKQASADVKHVYTIRINAHNFSEISKISNIVEANFDVVPATTQIPNGTSYITDVTSTQKPEEVVSSIQKEVEGGKVYLPDNAYNCSNYACPCGCGQQHSIQTTPEQQTTVEYMLVPVTQTNTQPIISYASSLETLKKYAEAKYKDYNIYDSAKNVVASSEKQETTDRTFAEELTAFLDEQISLSKKADAFNANGEPKNEGEPPNPGDVYVNKNGKATIITSANTESDPTLVAEGAEENEPQKEIDPNEKSSDETKAKGDDNVKRWKGMREDTQTGKFVVYITETEEHIFDTADAAIDFMTKK